VRQVGQLPRIKYCSVCQRVGFDTNKI